MFTAINKFENEMKMHKIKKMIYLNEKWSTFGRVVHLLFLNKIFKT